VSLCYRNGTLGILHSCDRASWQISLYYIDKPTGCNFMQSHLFFIAIHSACFGCFPRPSSGAQLNCSYSHRYISSVCVVWLISIVQQTPDLGHLSTDLSHTTRTLEMYLWL
jgi:hypothetical protein